MKSRGAVVIQVAAALVAAGAMASEKKVQLKDLPPAVQATVQVETRDLPAYHVSEEEEGGKVVYELETEVNGLSRDLVIDGTGVVVEVEEELDPARLPAAARKAVESAAGGGFIRKVEAITRDGVTEYEVSVKGGHGKSRFLVTGDGTLQKE
jgi:hypothetical protein